jgi:hypothetical protein
MCFWKTWKLAIWIANSLQNHLLRRINCSLHTSPLFDLKIGIQEYHDSQPFLFFKNARKPSNDLLRPKPPTGQKAVFSKDVEMDAMR